jgi:hypothetical protein
MRFVTKELIGLTTTLVLAYLILVHSTGFSRSIAAAGKSYSGAVKTLQGR